MQVPNELKPLTTKIIKILIVEDERIVALDLKRRLTKLGYRVTGSAASGSEAMVLIDQELPNLILMDIHIQGDRDGVEVTHHLQKTHNIPVIYLTAYSEEKTVDRAKATRPYGYLLKPFSDRELHIAIQVSMERHEHEVLLRKNEKHFRLALRAAHLNTWEVVEDSSEIFMGRNPERGIEEILDWESFSSTINENDQQKVADFISKLRSKEDTGDEIEFGAQSHQWYKLYGRSFKKNEIGSYQIVGVLQEITESRLFKDRLAQAAVVFKYASEGIIILNKDRRFSCANDAFYDITNFNPEALKDSELPFLTSHSLGEGVYNNIWQAVDKQGHWRGEITAFRSNEEVIYVWLTIGLIPAEINREQQFVLMISNITEIHEARAQLNQLAYYDSLTNLPNRMLILDRLRLALANSIRDSAILGVMFIDLDKFKSINDTLGHTQGDIILRHVAQKILSVLRQSDSIGRLGGDEFIVIASNAGSNASLIKIAKKILACLSEPVMIGKIEVVPSCSIGISVYPDHSQDHDELLQMADTAMYEAKNKGRNNYALYDPFMAQKTVHHLARERELHNALIKDELVLYYQPKYSISEKKITGVEALIRWQHPMIGLLPPDQFIPIAEMSSLIVEIGNWVLIKACKQLAQWRNDGLNLSIAVNISIRQLSNKNLHQFIAELLHQYSLPANLLELEITESCLQNELVYITSLEQLESLGIPISIDDFGTGYSCLSSLKNLPISRLKVDQSFVKNIPHDANDCAIAAAIMALAQELNLKVTAEGVEEYDQANFLSNLGCDELQGYLLSRPVDSDQIPYLTKKLNQKF